MSSDPIEVLREVYWAGWRNAAEWANADDLLHDRGSEAYKKMERVSVQTALASLSAPKPSGDWVLVPREPTQAMTDAAWKYAVGGEAPDPGYAYRAMLAAALKPPPMNDNAVAVNESAPVNDKPESAEAVCPECKGKGWTPEAGVAFDDPVICPDCAGSGRAEHSITANESASPRPEASAPVGVEEAFEEYHKADHRDPAVAQEWEWWQASWKASLAQQPAAVDGALERLRREGYPRLWHADLVGGQISVVRMREILTAALAGQQQGGPQE